MNAYGCRHTMQRVLLQAVAAECGISAMPTFQVWQVNLS